MTNQRTSMGSSNDTQSRNWSLSSLTAHDAIETFEDDDMFQKSLDKIHLNFNKKGYYREK